MGTPAKAAIFRYKKRYRCIIKGNAFLNIFSGYHFESASELTSLLYLQTGAAKAAIIRR